jgi:hypothetical protein
MTVSSVAGSNRIYDIPLVSKSLVISVFSSSWGSTWTVQESFLTLRAITGVILPDIHRADMDKDRHRIPAVICRFSFVKVLFFFDIGTASFLFLSFLAQFGVYKIPTIY